MLTEFEHRPTVEAREARIRGRVWNNLASTSTGDHLGSPDALLSFLDDRKAGETAGEIEFQPPTRGMLARIRKPTRHICRETPPSSEGCGGWPCLFAWERSPDLWFLARVTEGPDWWDLDDALAAAAGVRGFALPGRSMLRPVYDGHLSDVLAAFAERSSRLVVHRLTVD